jgi:hypothetical protein
MVFAWFFINYLGIFFFFLINEKCTFVIKKLPGAVAARGSPWLLASYI